MKAIVWDVDDVLNDLMRCWFEQYWLLTHPHCTLKYEDITENSPHRILGITLKEHLDSLDTFRFSNKEAEEMKPVPEVMDWFTKYGKYFRHMALTARPLNTVSAAANWVFRYFGAWMRTFHFIPSNREGQHLPEYDCDKSDYLLWLGKVDVLVDDSPANIEAARRMKVMGVLMPRPWNKSNFTISEALSLLTQLSSNDSCTMRNKK